MLAPCMETPTRGQRWTFVDVFFGVQSLRAATCVESSDRLNEKLNESASMPTT